MKSISCQVFRKEKILEISKVLYQNVEHQNVHMHNVVTLESHELYYYKEISEYSIFCVLS